MASIVKVPKDNTADYDFIAFSFDGKHSYEDFGIYRVSDGDRYNEKLTPTLTDRTADNPARDGQYYFGTQHKQKVFDINFAFEELTEAKLSEMKRWFSGKKIADLWFAEMPHKIYSAKVTGTPSVKALCFNKPDGSRVYRGEGNVQFTCYYPYAHTPDSVDISNVLTDQSSASQLPGESKESYRFFSNFEQIEDLLPGGKDLPFGEAPFYFTAWLSGPNDPVEGSLTACGISNTEGIDGPEQSYTISNGVTTHLLVDINGATLTAVEGYGEVVGRTLVLGGQE